MSEMGYTISIQISEVAQMLATPMRPLSSEWSKHPMPDTQSTPTRRCSKCGNEFPLTPDHFYRDKSRKEGFCYTCKTCDLARVTAAHNKNPEVQRAAQKRFAKKHPDRVKAAEKYWRERNAERVQAYDKAYKAAHKEQSSASNKAYKAKHRDHGRELSKIWRETHRDQVLQHKRVGGSKRRARKAAVGGTYTKEDIQSLLEAQKGRCYYCHEKLKGGYHVDHVIPLSRGGTNDPGNLVLACPSCNLSKNNKLPHEWPEGGRLL